MRGLVRHGEDGPGTGSGFPFADSPSASGAGGCVGISRCVAISPSNRRIAGRVKRLGAGGEHRCGGCGHPQRGGADGILSGDSADGCERWFDQMRYGQYVDDIAVNGRGQAPQALDLLQEAVLATDALIPE